MKELRRRICLQLPLLAAALALVAALPAAAFGADPAEAIIEAPAGTTEASSPGWSTEGGATATPAAPAPIRQGSSVGSGGGAPQKAPSTSAPTPTPTPPPSTPVTPPPTSEAPSYSAEPSEPSGSYAPEAAAPAAVEEPTAAPVAAPAPEPAAKPEPAPAPAKPVGKAGLAGATELTTSSPPRDGAASAEAPVAAAPAPTAGEEGGSSSYVTALLAILALCVLGLAAVQLRRYLRYRQIAAVKRERAATWDAAVHQIEARRALGALEPSTKGLHAVEAPDRSTHLAA